MTEGIGPWTGGCQCGAVRYRVTELGRASLCHCRMCQKATGGIGGLLVTAKGVEWTRGTPAHFRSSSKARRGFCAACGTPLTFEMGGSVDILIPTFDEAAAIRPAVQHARESRLPWTDSLHSLPGTPSDEIEAFARHYASVESYQHPDHETSQP